MGAAAHQKPPRRKQRAITIRSDRAFKRLELLARGGRSQAEIIEEALERMPLRAAQAGLEAFRRKVASILEGVDPKSIPGMAEFDDAAYDESGLPR